jgi:hypothetical protein
MSFFSTISTKAQLLSGRGLVAAMQAINANFAKVAPGITNSGAADYVLAVGDRMVGRSRATAQTLTLPSNATAPIEIGTSIPVVVTGAGTLTFQAGAGATITKLAAKALTCLTGGTVVARKISTNGWAISGDLG